MNDYKDINDLISSTEANKSAYVDYLLEYAEGDYHCLDGSADNEILAFSSFALKFKHVYALAILLKLQETTDTSKFAKAFSNEFQINIKIESEELENLLFYIRNSLPEDLFHNNCDKFKNGNGIIKNKWNYPYDIIEMQEKQIRYLMEECQGERFQERICDLRQTLLVMENKLEDLKRRLEIEENKCAYYKHSLVDIKDQLVNMVARTPTHEGMLHKLEGMLYELNTFINGL